MLVECAMCGAEVAQHASCCWRCGCTMAGKNECSGQRSDGRWLKITLLLSCLAIVASAAMLFDRHWELSAVIFSAVMVGLISGCFMKWCMPDTHQTSVECEAQAIPRDALEP